MPAVEPIIVRNPLCSVDDSSVFWTRDDFTVPLSREFQAEGPRAIERDRRIRVLEVGTLAMFVIAGIAAYRMWILGVTNVVVALAITVVACGLNLVWLRLGAPVERIGNFSVGIFYGLILISITATGGFYDPNFAWLYAIPIGAALLVDVRSSFYWAGIAALTTFVFWLMAGSGIDLPNLIPIEQRHGQALFNRVSLLAGLMVFAMSFASAQRRVEHSLAQRNSALRLEARCVRLLQHAAVAANESDDFDAAIDTCVERVLQTTGWMLSLIWEPVTDGSDEWGCQDRVCSSGGLDARELVSISRELRFKEGELALGRVLETAQPAWASGSELKPETSRRARAAVDVGLNSAVAIPVTVRGRVIRIVEFFGSESNAPDERLIEILCEVGCQLGRVAERVRLQESVRRSQRLESVGQLAAGIAHEINNPMAYVRANLGMLWQEWNEIREAMKGSFDPAKLRQELDGCDELIVESIDGVDRAVGIVRDMREFARDGGGTPEPVAVDQLVDGSLRVAASAKPMGATVMTDLEPGLEIVCLPTRMRQVFLNLVVNAFHAIHDEGTLRIRSRSVGNRLVVEFEDDGHGIYGHDRERIFEPFYTTKPAGQGTGLGLYISFEIVRWHGGTIDVDSEPGHGARFSLDLPLNPSDGEL